jgi:outer membrane protein
MKRSLMLLGMGAALMLPLSAEEKPRTGVVHIQTLFRDYYKTLEAQAQINAERARIQKEENEMLQRVKVFDEKLRDQTKRLQDSELEEEERSALSRDVGMLFQEREALERLRKQSIQARHLELNQKMVARMNGILEEIRGIIAESAEGAGFDYVFDVEGLSTAQVPFLLYAKDATDITPMIQKELGKGAPAE